MSKETLTITSSHLQVKPLLKFVAHSNHLKTGHINKPDFLCLVLNGTTFKNWTQGSVLWDFVHFQSRFGANIEKTNECRICHLKSRAFGNRIHIHHLKTGLVWYLDGYCIFNPWYSSSGNQMVKSRLDLKWLIFL